MAMPEDISAVGQFLPKTAITKSKQIPVWVIGSGGNLYMLYLKRKYMKIALHMIEAEPDEISLWANYHGDSEGLNTFLVALNDLKNSGIRLGPYSLNILMLETVEEQLQFYEQAKDFKTTTYDNATCMTNLYVDYESPGAPTQLVVGTELGWLLFLNDSGADYIVQHLLDSPPVKLVAKGAFSKEYSVFALTRDNRLVKFSDGKERGIIALQGTPSSLVLTDTSLLLGFVDGTLQSLSFDLVPLRTISTELPISSMGDLYLERLGKSKGVAVVGGGFLRVYDPQGFSLLSQTPTQDEVIALKFGKIGREEGCLLLLYKNKGIEIKILNRRAVFGNDSAMSGAVAKVYKEKEGEKKEELKPPAISKILKEQLEVDKQKALGVYNSYQKDTLRLKNLIDTHFIKLLEQGLTSETKMIKIHSEIEGLGPVFLIKLEIINQNPASITDLSLTFQFNDANYNFIDSVPEVKCLLPSMMFPVSFRVKNIDPLGSNPPIKVFIIEKKGSKPIAGTILNMPICDPIEPGPGE